MGDPPDSRSQSDIANRLHSVAIHLLRRVRREDELTALSPARLSALSVVGFAGPVTVSDLATAEQVSKPTISRIVAALEHDGLVARESDPADARVARIVATEKGLRVLTEGRLRRTEQIDQILGTLSPDDLAAVARAIESLERVLGGAH